FVDIIIFFFSSRRRHTRSKRDWSSDVCSSDLILLSLVGFCLFIMLFSKLFSFFWFRVLFFAAIILFSYFYTKSLIYTVSLTGIIVILIISQSHLVNKKWRRVLEIISFISLLAIHEYIFT